MHYSFGSDQIITYWLLRQNHVENKDKEIAGMKLSTEDISPTKDIPTCVPIKEIVEAIQNDVHLQLPKEYIINSWMLIGMECHKTSPHT